MLRIRCRLNCKDVGFDYLSLRSAAFITRLCQAFPATQFRLRRLTDAKVTVDPKSITALVSAGFSHGDDAILEVDGKQEDLAARFFRVAWTNLDNYCDDVAAGRTKLARMIDHEFASIPPEELGSLPLSTPERSAEQFVAFDLSEISLTVSRAVSEKVIAYFAQHPSEMRTMNRRLFEELVAELWAGFGYEVELTKQTRDGGKDIIAIKNEIVEEKFLIECKRPQPGTILGVKPVRELLGVKCAEGATKAILATTTYFSEDAKLLFERMKWELEGRDFEGLQAWIRNYLLTKGYGQW